MRIGITGTHSTGKTTLVEALRTEPYFSDYFYDINVTRWVRSLGLPINEDTVDSSQEINMIKRIAHLNSYDKIISDRTILDVFAYSRAGKNISSRSLKYQEDLINRNISKYDILFYLPMEIPVADDGVRTIDPVYREQIDNYIVELLKTHEKKNNLTVVKLTGSVRNRIQQIFDYIEAKE